MSHHHDFSAQSCWQHSKPNTGRSWAPCECTHLGVSHSSDGPCSVCECSDFREVS